MTLVVNHGFLSAHPDNPADQTAGKILPSHWNAAHNITGTVDDNQLSASVQALEPLLQRPMGEDVLAGQLVRVTSGGVLLKANASTFNTSDVAGLLLANTLNTFAGTLRRQRLDLSDWTAVIGTASLTPNAAYFLDTTAGKMTTTAPTIAGQANVFVGTALSTTTFIIEIGIPILL